MRKPRTTRRHRTFKPDVAPLESRQLLSLAIAESVQHGDYADVTFESYGGQYDAMRDQLKASVGSQWNIQVDPNRTGVTIDQIVYSTPNSLAGEFAQPQHDETVNQTTRLPETVLHTCDGAWSSTPIMQDGTDFLSGYADEHTGTDVLGVTITFKTNGFTPVPEPEHFEEPYIVSAPSASLNATFPTSMYFGPIVKNASTGAAAPAPWGSQPTTGSYFGSQPNGWMRYSVSGSNSTPVQGTFSTIQLVKGVMQIDAVDVTLTGNLVTGPPKSYQPVSWQTLADQNEWISDVGPGSDAASFRLLATPGQYMNASAPSATEAFGDCPRVLLPNPANTNRFAYSFTEADDFETEILWTPTGGTAIAVAIQPWSIRLFKENPTAATNPSWNTSYGALAQPLWQDAFPSYIKAGAEIDTPTLVRNTDRNATEDIHILFNQPDNGWFPSLYTVDANGPTNKAVTAPQTLIAQAPPASTTTTNPAGPAGTTTTTTTSTADLTSGSRLPLWADNSVYPNGVVPGLSNSTNGIPNGYWQPTPQGAPVPIPPGMLVVQGNDGPMLWDPSWGTFTPDMQGTAPTQVAQAPTPTTPPAGPVIENPNATTTIQDAPPTVTNPGLPVPPYAENIPGTSPVIDPTTTAALTTIGLVTIPADSHLASAGWLQMPDGHFWNPMTGAGYVDGDTLDTSIPTAAATTTPATATPPMGVPASAPQSEWGDMWQGNRNYPDFSYTYIDMRTGDTIFVPAAGTSYTPPPAGVPPTAPSGTWGDQWVFQYGSWYDKTTGHYLGA